jgi:hypothetical protein
VRNLALALAATLLLACGVRDSADDQTLHQDIASNANGAEVTFDATVASDPVTGGDHERFMVRSTTGENLEVDHNTKLAAFVPVHTGDKVIIHGKLYIDPGPRYGVHCTHAHTSGGCPAPGWIEFNNTYYE